jgi:hypothetical protein
MATGTGGLLLYLVQDFAKRKIPKNFGWVKPAVIPFARKKNKRKKLQYKKIKSYALHGFSGSMQHAYSPTDQMLPEVMKRKSKRMIDQSVS